MNHPSGFNEDARAMLAAIPAGTRDGTRDGGSRWAPVLVQKELGSVTHHTAVTVEMETILKGRYGGAY